MGRHSAERIPARDLPGAYLRLRETYERLLRDHMQLAERLGLLDTPSGGPLSYRATGGHLASGLEPMDVDTACALVRDWGLLTAPGVGA